MTRQITEVRRTIRPPALSPGRDPDLHVRRASCELRLADLRAEFARAEAACLQRLAELDAEEAAAEREGRDTEPAPCSWTDDQAPAWAVAEVE